MIFSVDPKQLVAALSALDRFSEQLRRLNDNLERGGAGTPAAAPGSSSPAHPRP